MTAKAQSNLNHEKMDYKQIDFNIQPSSEVAQDVLSAMLGEVGFDTFEPTETGLRAYIPAGNFSDDAVQQCLVDFFMPDMYEIKTICAFTQCNNVQEEIASYIEQQSDDTEIIAFSDITFGSVNQWLGIYKQRPHYHLFSGTNLPLIMSVLLKPKDVYLSDEDIQQIIQECTGSVVYVNTLQAQTDEDDE